jgi:RNA polymerase sigma-70 factor, ECF subfamily
MIQEGVIEEFVITDFILERCREYLRSQVGAYLSPHLRGKFDPSDAVQETLLTAQEKQGQFRGQSESEFFGWLRQIMRNHIAIACRRFRALARDVARERSLNREGMESSDRTGIWLAANHSSPSRCLARQEELHQLTGALAQLPEDQRRAVELHHMKGYTVAQVADSLGRSKSAVVGLLFRGMSNLRRLLDNI